MANDAATMTSTIPARALRMETETPSRQLLYNPKNRHERKEFERFKSFTYEDLTKRDKLNLDIFWLKDESLEDSANLPDPDIIAAEIVEDLQAALAQFTEIANDLRK
jgi:type I restriction enzyme M protein